MFRNHFQSIIFTEIWSHVTWWSFLSHSVLKHWELKYPHFSFQLEWKKGTDCSSWMTSAITSDLSQCMLMYTVNKITFYANSLIPIQIYSCVCLELVRTDLWPWWWTGIEEFVFVYTHVIVTDRAAATSRLCSISQSVLNCLETEAKQFDHSPCILDIWNKERKRKMESKIL